MELQKRNEELKEASGEVAFSDPLTTFLYLLMRNELPAGKVEGLVREAVDSSEECLFTNGWLAHYANNLAETIKDAKANHLKSALEKAFVEHKKEKVEKAVEKIEEKAKDVKDSADENFGDKALSELEQKLIQISGESKVTDTGEEKPKTSGEIAVGAKEAVQQLVASGFMSQDDADNLKSDIGDVVTEAEKPVGDAEEIVKEHTEEEKWTAEKAGHVVKKAFRAFERAAVEKVSDEAVTEVKEQEDSKVTTVDVTGATEEDVAKWKKTNEELQKQNYKEVVGVFTESAKQITDEVLEGFKNTNEEPQKQEKTTTEEE